MDLTYGLGLVILALASIVATQIWSKAKKTRMRTMWIGVIVGGIGLVSLLSPGTIGFLDKSINLGGGTLAVAPSSGGVSPTIATYQPTASYETQDKYSSTSVSGTSYYKAGGSLAGYSIVGGTPASTTAITNTKSGNIYTYWVSNGTYWVKPLRFTAGTTDNIVNKEVWQNGTATLTGYDLVNKQAVTTGAYNTSMGANDQANIEFTYQGTNKRSAVPFGGVLAVEYNSTISDVSCTGDGIEGLNSGFQVTYTPTNTANIVKLYKLAYGFDGGTGSVKTFTCQFNNGATAVGAGSMYTVSIISANYYDSQAGDILLDTEKSADSSTTRTGINVPTMNAYWGA